MLSRCLRIRGHEIPHLDWKNKCCWRSDLLLSTEVNKKPTAAFKREGFGWAPESCLMRPGKQIALSAWFVHSRYWHFILGVNSKLQIVPHGLAFSVNLGLGFGFTNQPAISP